MRQRIVERLASHDLAFALGALVFTCHVEGCGPHLPAGATLVQLIEDPQVAAWGPPGTTVVGSIRLGLLDLLAPTAPPRRPLPEPHTRAARVPEPSPDERLPVPRVFKTLTDIRPCNSIIV